MSVTKQSVSKFSLIVCVLLFMFSIISPMYSSIEILSQKESEFSTSEPGNYTNVSSGNQSPCPPGTYQPLPNQTSCLDADEGYYVPINSWSYYHSNKLSTGTEHACAILDNGSVSCWGSNGNGKLGDGTTTNRDTPTLTSSLGQGRTAIAISAAAAHTCAILDNGSVSCWGSNAYGNLGDGGPTWWNSHRTTPAQTASLGVGRTAVAIDSGRSHTCVILDDGTVSCWGWNVEGTIGDGTTTNRDTPTLTSSLGSERTAVSITAGAYHTCVILDDGSVSCWGMNDNGRLGDGTTNDSHTPIQTSSLGVGRTAVAIDAGESYTCVLLDDGSVSCWGHNSYGSLGDGTTTDRHTPTQTSILGTGQTAVGISGGGIHTCAILDDGTVSCWGNNYYGQLGDGTYTDSTVPTQTDSLGSNRTAVAISSGGHDFTCAILDNGTISCWGQNFYYQLGDGTSTTRNTPAQTASLGNSRFAATANSTSSVVGNTGMTFQTACSLGTYQASTGQISCTVASIGFYVDQTASINQTSCPQGTSTNSIGSVSINDCYTDTDSDGITDLLDSDDDNDGYLDDLDAFPLDPNEWEDTDNDGIGNNADDDDDGDGYLDDSDAFPLDSNEWFDTDNDGIGNNADDDDDGDGYLDDSDAFPLDSNECFDTDGDDVGDNADLDDDNDSYPDSNDDFPLDECAVLDTDGDGMPDWIFLNCNTNLSEDLDDDNDGYNDTNDSHPLDPTEWFDTDLDGIGNNADTDDDGDNVPDQFDAFPLDSTEWMDTDGDGVGDNADTDDDDDGVLDTNDDFPNDANETTDTDGDGIGNNADDDDDGDGYLDIYDQFPLDSTEWIDTDLDGIGNNADPDDDGDGWTDNDEFICGSDELDANDVPDDSDGDGICDSEEDDITGMAIIVDVISNPLVVVLFLLMGMTIIITLFLQSRNQSSRINELEGMLGNKTIIEDIIEAEIIEDDRPIN